MGDIEKFIIEAFRPYIVPFMVGAAWAVWKFKDAILGRPEAKKDVVHRRRDDEMMTRFLDAFERSTAAHQKIADALSQNGERLEHVANEVKLVGGRLEQFTREVKDALVDIHRRIDDLYLATRASNGDH
jgi:hypothetical protein